MKRFSVFQWDRTGPQPPEDVAALWPAMKMTSENGEANVSGQAARVAAMAATIRSNQPLLANTEGYADNTVAAIALSAACESANPAVRFGCYHPDINGGTYYDVAGSNGKKPIDARASKTKSDERQRITIKRLDPWVHVWFLDMFTCENTDAELVKLWQRDESATREIVFGRRVQAIAHTDKPWYGVLGVCAIPPNGATKAQAKTIQQGTDFSADSLYADAAWCLQNGAEGIVLMAFDPRRRAVAGTGDVRYTPEIERALRQLAKL